MVEYIDLSYPIKKHWRWSFHRTLDRDYLLGGPLREEIIYMPVHCFTHIDPPSHVNINKATIDQIPLSDLIGIAKIIDFTDFPEKCEITARDLDERSRNIENGDIIIIKTCHGIKYTLDGKGFWFQSPYMGEDAGKWIVNKKVRAVGFDFPQDYALRDFFTGIIPPIEQMHMHNILLNNNIIQIEYLTNLDKIIEDEIMIYAIPLRLEGMAGSPARVFALRGGRF